MATWKLYLPARGDIESVAKQCEDLLLAAFYGYWAEFPQADWEASTGESKRLTTALEATRTLVAAIVPVSIVAVADQVSNSFVGSAATWTWVAAVSWGVIGLLVFVDPRIGEKLELFQRIRSWVPGDSMPRHEREARSDHMTIDTRPARGRSAPDSSNGRQNRPGDSSRLQLIAIRLGGYNTNVT